MTLEELIAARDQARTDARAILDRATGDLTGDDATRFDELTTAIETHNRDIEQMTQRRDRANQLVTGTRTGTYRVETPGVTGDNTDNRPPSQRDNVLRVLERATTEDRLTDTGAELVERLATTGPAAAQSWTQRWAIATGSNEYERAFAKLLTGDKGHLDWTPEEADSYRTVSALRMEQRAMSLTDTAGGFMVPLTLDPAVMLTSAGSTNPLRQLARVVQTTTDSWNGITSAGVTAEWTAEAAEVADASPTLGQPSIPVHKGDAFVPFSFEVEGDALGFLTELGKLLQDGAEQLSATAYTTGPGTTAPKGIITGVSAVPGSVVNSSGTEAIAAADVFALQNALPPRFQPNATWSGHLSVLNTLRQFETTAGALKFPALQDGAPSLLGRPVHENSNMDGVINPAATENNFVLLYGDVAQGFVIADRLGSTIELVPHLFGGNGRPTGQRGALLYFRTGSDVVNPAALRVLKVATTA